MNARAKAQLIDRERTRIENAGLRAVNFTLITARAAAIRAFQQGKPVALAMVRAMEPIVPQLTSAMLTAHLQGRLTAYRFAGRADKTVTLAKDPYEQALKSLYKRMRLTPADAAVLREKYGEIAVSTTADLARHAAEKVNAAVVESVKLGEHRTAGIKRLSEAFKSAGLSPGGGGDAPSMSQVETLYRTNVQLGYSAGQWQANQEPEIDSILWGNEYSAVNDDRTRPAHAAMDGVRRPKDDPIWNTWTPPCGFNCRCTLIPIFKGDSIAEPTPVPTTTEADGKEYAVTPDPGFAFNPGEALGGVLRV